MMIKFTNRKNLKIKKENDGKVWNERGGVGTQEEEGHMALVDGVVQSISFCPPLVPNHPKKKKKKTQNLSSNFKPIPHIPQYPFSPLSFFSFPFPSLFLLCVFVYGCGSPISLLHFVSQTLNIFPLSLSLHPLISFPLLKLGFFVSPFQSRLRFYKRYYYNYILEKLYFEQLYH